MDKDLPAEQRQSIDLMRIVAAFGIVWAHMEAPLMILGYVALALFIILMAVLAWNSAETRDFGRFLRGRARRVLVPWLVWCALYLALEALRLRDPSRLWTVTDWRWLLIGPVVHLWFLPFAFLAAPAIHAGTRALTTPGRVWIAALALAPVAFWTIRLHDLAPPQPPFVQWVYAATPLFYGILSAAARRHGGWPAPLVMVALATLPPTFLWQSLLAPNLLAAAFLFEAFWRADIRSRLLPALGRLAFGIYLVHPVFMLVWFRVAGDTLSRGWGAVAVFLASALAAVAMQALPIRPRRG